MLTHVNQSASDPRPAQETSRCLLEVRMAREWTLARQPHCPLQQVSIKLGIGSWQKQKRTTMETDYPEVGGGAGGSLKPSSGVEERGRVLDT